MARIVDITDKLNFEEKPSIKINDTVIKVNNDAPSMLEVIAIMQSDKNSSPASIKRLAELLFDPEEHDKIVALKLDIRDYSMMIMQTAKAAANIEDDEGEAPTPTTT